MARSLRGPRGGGVHALKMTGDKDNRMKLAALLRSAAAQTISEHDFWKRFDDLVRGADDRLAGIVFETATHFWGNFHQRNIFLIPTKPDKGQVLQGKNELNLIADALEGNWSIPELQRKLADI